MQVLSITPLLLIEPSTMMEKDLSHTQTQNCVKMHLSMVMMVMTTMTILRHCSE